MVLNLERLHCIFNDNVFVTMMAIDIRAIFLFILQFS